MADNRIQLNDMDLENVIGGAFHYVERKGQTFCVVDGIGTFFAKPDAFQKIAAYASDTSLTSQQVVDWAISNGYLSKNPF